jgi:hypothetical protein
MKTLRVGLVLLGCACSEATGAPSAPPTSTDAGTAPEVDASEGERDGGPPRTSKDAGQDAGGAHWDYSPMDYDRVLGVLAHPTDARRFGVLVADGSKVKLKLSSDDGSTFARARLVCEVEGARILAAEWSRTDPSSIAVIAAGQFAVGSTAAYASVDGGTYFFGRSEYGPSYPNPKSFSHLSTEGGILRVRTVGPAAGSTLVTLSADVPAPGSGSGSEWRNLDGAPGTGVFAIRPGAPDEVLAASGGTIRRCIGAACTTSTIPGSFTEISSIEYGRDDTSRALASGYDLTAGTQTILLSIDAGATFAALRTSSLAGAPQAFFDRRAGSRHIFARAGDRVHRSRDHGATWEDVTPPQDLVPGSSTATIVQWIAPRADGGLLAYGTFRYYVLGAAQL